MSCLSLLLPQASPQHLLFGFFPLFKPSPSFSLLQPALCNLLLKISKHRDSTTLLHKLFQLYTFKYTAVSEQTQGHIKEWYSRQGLRVQRFSTSIIQNILFNLRELQSWLPAQQYSQMLPPASTEGDCQQELGFPSPTLKLLPGRVATPSFHSRTRMVLQVCTPLI